MLPMILDCRLNFSLVTANCINPLHPWFQPI